MNRFGRMFQVQLWGESHGGVVGVTIDGVPAGLPLSEEDLEPDLARRRPGRPGTTPRREDDLPLLETGVFRGRCTGAPLQVRFVNRDRDSSAYDRIRSRPRPGHADLTARMKFGGYEDYRGGGHFSGRLTVGLVAAGAVAKRILAKLGDEVSVRARVIRAGGESDVSAAVARAQADGDSVGGLVECRVAGLPPGLGEPFFDSLESCLAHAIFAIPAVKGVEFGAGFEVARMRGSACNDAIVDAQGRTATNHAGGIHGGISNGNELVLRVAVKPTSSISRAQQTVDLDTGEVRELKIEGRHDACIALRFPVVLEAAVALVLADLALLAQRVPRVV